MFCYYLAELVSALHGIRVRGLKISPTNKSYVQQKVMSMAVYMARTKEIYDSLATINVTVEEDEMVQVYIRGLTSKFEAFRMAVNTREDTHSFFELQSMLLIEENHVGASSSTHADGKMLYMEDDRPRGRGGRGGSARNGGG